MSHYVGTSSSPPDLESYQAQLTAVSITLFSIAAMCILWRQSEREKREQDENKARLRAVRRAWDLQDSLNRKRQPFVEDYDEDSSSEDFEDPEEFGVENYEESEENEPVEGTDGFGETEDENDDEGNAEEESEPESVHLVQQFSGPRYIVDTTEGSSVEETEDNEGEDETGDSQDEDAADVEVVDVEDEDEDEETEVEEAETENEYTMTETEDETSGYESF